MISDDAINSDENDNKFINIYFKNIYINIFNVNDWSYYKIYVHKTNNSDESFYHVLNLNLTINQQFGNLLAL